VRERLKQEYSAVAAKDLVAPFAAPLDLGQDCKPMLLRIVAVSLLWALALWLGVRSWRTTHPVVRRPAEIRPDPVAQVPARPPTRVTDFTLTSIEGKRMRLASYRAKSPIVLEYFSVN
jgi:hypothetical protein